ncbi:MAG: hypothetical protein AVDCRST_MAG38-2832 [uncultured Solirubrobacteraceae bacterium]|uniref:Uncharacterized protein n=1 Tax=uncultured Solirubrobacteraceae bacterium TaxID=1162706 RepID=A0A6J4SCE9_9ACTN|nr:MAG: hypothetical protein AVDCRST_MAG38-2832 [uncultured Solirubrobacteraceae bacterium]
MANQTRMHDTSSPSRFGRTSGKSTAGRSSARPANMGKRSLRAGQGEVGAKGRFGLGSSLGPSGYGRPSPKSSGGTGRSRRLKRNVTPEKSGMGKALSALGGLSGTKAAKKAPSRSAKPAGFALLAGAAGLALKNRDKLMGLAHRGGSSNEGAPSGTVYGDGTATGVRTDNGMPASAIGVTEGQVPGSDTIDNPTADQRLTD